MNPLGNASEDGAQDAEGKWSAAEEFFERESKAALSDSVAVLRETEGLAFDLLSSAEAVSPPELLRTHALLLRRCLQDQRMALVAAQRGYTVQSWTVVSSCIEAAYAMGCIADDLSKARTWLNHERLDQPLWGVYDCMLHTHRSFGLELPGYSEEERVRLEYQAYKHVCAAKHVNPVMERHRGIDDAAGRLHLSPVVSDDVIRAARYGLAIAARCGTVAIYVFRRVNIPMEYERFDVRIVALAKRGAELLDDRELEVDPN